MSKINEENKIVALTHEGAWDAISELKQRDEYETDSTRVIRGIHPTYGSCVFVIPPFGEVLLAPMVIANTTFDGTLTPG